MLFLPDPVPCERPAFSLCNIFLAFREPLKPFWEAGSIQFREEKERKERKKQRKERKKQRRSVSRQRMEISSLELDLLCREISEDIGGYYLSGVYPMKGGIVLRINHSEKPEKLIAISSFATWLSSKNLLIERPDPFVFRLRNLIERERIIKVETVGGERIARFSFESREKKAHNLYCEFFGRGNIIVTSVSERDSQQVEEEILDVMNPQKFRHRSLVIDEKYVLPPPRGEKLQSISEDFLLREADRSRENSREGSNSAIKWFGRIVGTSRKFIEEIFYRSGVKPDTPVGELDRQTISKIVRSAEELVKEVYASRTGYLLVPKEIEQTDGNSLSNYSSLSGASSRQREREDELYEEIDASPIILHSWREKVERGLASILNFSSLSSALDEAESRLFLMEKRAKVSREVRSKISELESAIAKQNKLLEELERQARDLRELASNLMRESHLEIDDGTIDKLLSMGILEREEKKKSEPASDNAEEQEEEEEGGVGRRRRESLLFEDRATGGPLRFVSEPRSYVSSYNRASLASRLYDEAKASEEKKLKLVQVRKDLERQRVELESQSKVREEREQRKVAIERRPRQWFERYRWFLTSSGQLALGGRDSTSNSIVINKYTQPGDVVFHADLHGSPFFVLKAKKVEGEGRGRREERENREREEDKRDLLSEEIAWELAQATVSFSRAWKNELSAADAYWILPEQVKKAAPSGQYLPRGSFFIEGKKNFIKNVKVELAVGLVDYEVMMKVVGSQESSGGKKHLVVMCGPERALSNYCLALVKISYGREKSSSIARKIKQQLIGQLKQSDLKDLAKRIPIEEFIRVLPAGTHKLTSSPAEKTKMLRVSRS